MVSCAKNHTFILIGCASLLAFFGRYSPDAIGLFGGPLEVAAQQIPQVAPRLVSESFQMDFDRSFEKRLVILAFYKARKGDTLPSISRFLYGHKNWWPKLKKENPALRSYSLGREVPQGKLIRYRRPEIGATYVVQPNDWLARIVQWKYGDTGLWEKIYQRNSRTISDPNVIRPGDVLTLELNGTVRKKGLDQALVVGVEPTEVVRPVSMQPVSHLGLLAVPSHDPDVQVVSRPISISANKIHALLTWIHFYFGLDNFSLGCLAGLVLLFLASMTGRLKQRSNRPAPPVIRTVPQPRKANHQVQSSSTASRLTEKLSSQWRRFEGGLSRFHFIQRRVDRMSLLYDLIHRDRGDLERPLGYELISKKGPKVKKN